jgi:hypothetical protein
MISTLEAYESATEINYPILQWKQVACYDKKKRNTNKMMKIKLCMVLLVSNALLNADLLSALFSAASY